MTDEPSIPLSQQRRLMVQTRNQHECPGCRSEYPSAWAAAACCDPDYDLPSFVRAYD